MEIGSAISAWFTQLGSPVPRVQIISGFPSSGRRSRRIAECWPDDGGRAFRMLVRPDTNDPYRLAGAIALNLACIAAGSGYESVKQFRHLAISVGLRGRRTESSPGLLFRELMKPILQQAGEVPRSDEHLAPVIAVAKQRTRLVRVACSDCGYVVRVAQKWLDQIGPPLCPLHGAMRNRENRSGEHKSARRP